MLPTTFYGNQKQPLTLFQAVSNPKSSRPIVVQDPCWAIDDYHYQAASLDLQKVELGILLIHFSK